MPHKRRYSNEHSKTSWRAQVVVKNPSHPNKKRLCIEYFQTVNQYTEVDAYTLLGIDDMITNLARYPVFSIYIYINNVDRKYSICDSDKKSRYFF